MVGEASLAVVWTMQHLAATTPPRPHVLAAMAMPDSVHSARQTLVLAREALARSHAAITASRGILRPDNDNPISGLVGAASQLAPGAHLKQLRHRHGLTQEAVAALAGVQQQQVSRWERGAATIPAAKRRLLARAFKTAPSAFEELS